MVPDSFSPPRVLRRAWTVNPPLTGAVVVLVLVTLVALVGLVVDPRVITGQPAWAKPARFAFSFALYAATLLWLLTFVRGHERLVRAISWITAAGVVVEVVWAAGSAAAGTTSHFNFTTPLSSTLVVTMLIVITVVVLTSLATIGLLLHQRVEPPALAWALRLGLVVGVVGMATAVPMVSSPTLEQEVAEDLGQGMPISGGHTVGEADGGPGMLVTNFSTTAGDLRIAHFVGIHSLQALCLIGLLLTLGPRILPPRHRVAVVWIAATSLLALTGILFWQALRAQPLTSPDLATTAALTALAVGAAAATTAVFVHARIARSTARAAPP
ncbi:hypothetical protein [Streptomyces sp. NPDC048057]|uniref:hypothetical protein n=1 Tax=Streptomyces sp. NPDC048057 TaxID=3155628 RepID=UPI0033F63340